MIGGLFFSLFVVAEIKARADLEVDGVVLNSVLKGTVRPVRTYVLRFPNSDAQFKYAAGPNDHSLSRSVPNGAHVIKKKGDLTYTVDGRVINDSPTGAYLGLLALAVTAFVAGSIAGIRWFRAYYRSL